MEAVSEFSDRAGMFRVSLAKRDMTLADYLPLDVDAEILAGPVVEAECAARDIPASEVHEPHLFADETSYADRDLVRRSPYNHTTSQSLISQARQPPLAFVHVECEVCR